MFSPPTIFLYQALILRVKYINGILKIKSNLDTTSKFKPIAGLDDLLLLLVQHQAWDRSVFPTKDDRHNVATILLFQSYTSGRPAEFVHSSKGEASKDPLGEAKEINKKEEAQNKADKELDNGDNASGGLEYDDNSDAGDDSKYDSDDLFESLQCILVMSTPADFSQRYYA